MISQRALPGLQPTVLDLFSGAGGLSLGFEMANYQIIMGIEKDELAARTHSLNFDCPYLAQDISQIPSPEQYLQAKGLPRPDVIIGGPPCQGFSRVGRGKIRDLRKDPTYIHDPRNLYYREYLRFVKELQPVYFVMENVPDLRYYDDGDGRLLDKILHYFRSELGYIVDWKVLKAHHYGVPQTRERLLVVGNRLGNTVDWPKETHSINPITVWEAISDLPIVFPRHREDEIPYVARGNLTRYQREMRLGAGAVLFNHQTRWHNQQDLEAFTWLPEGGKYIDLPDEFRRYRHDIFKDKYRKLYRDRPSWTIEAHIGKDTYRHIYPSRDGEPEPPRTISVREAARLQSFPDRFRFLGPFTRQFHQIGNAVPPLLAKAIALAILPGVRKGVEATTDEGQEDNERTRFANEESLMSVR